MAKSMPFLQKEGGALTPIRQAEGARHEYPFLSEDGKRLYYSSTKDDPTFLKGYVYNLETEQEDVVVHGRDGMTILMEANEEESRFLFLRAFGNTNNLVYVKEGDEETLITPATEDQHMVNDATFVSNDEVYLLTNYGQDFTYLAKFNLTTKEFEKVLEREKEDFAHLKYDKTTESIYLVGSKGVQDALYQYHLKDGELTSLAAPVSIIHQLVVAKSGNVYIRGNYPTVPTNLYQLTSKGWTKLTNFGVPGVKEENLATPVVVTYPSFDGVEIEALLFKPTPEKDNGHMILWPHGGPQAAERASFRSLFSFLVYQGYSLFAPNFRGSTGYGLEFTKMVEGDWGHGPRLDKVAGLEWLINQGHASRDKIFLMGGSYGGYMALLLHGRHPEYFKAVVDIFGPSSLFSFIESVPEHWKPIMDQLVGHPEKDKEKLTEDSPITYLDSMTKPMLVIQGAKDPRVVQAESDQLVEALREKGRDVEYIVLDDEGHGFSKKANEMLVYRKVMEFFEQYL